MDTKSSNQTDIELNEDELFLGSKKTITAAKNAKKKGKKMIGKAAIKAENNDQTDSRTPKKQKPPTINALKINRDELLQLAARIEVNGSNLRSIYDTRLINEQGLRRLVNMSLNDLEIGPALREEIIEETSHLSDYQSIFGEKTRVLQSERVIDTVLIGLIIIAFIMVITFMVSRI